MKRRPPKRLSYVLTGDLRLRIKEKAQRRGNHLIWMGAAGRHKDFRYPVLVRNGKVLSVRRLLLSDDPRAQLEKFYAVSTCREPLCIAQSHIELRSSREIQSPIQRAKFHGESALLDTRFCPRGHPLDEDKIMPKAKRGILRKRGRVCNLCKNTPERVKSHRQRRHEMVKRALEFYRAHQKNA